jgi:hypothetical protein
MLASRVEPVGARDSATRKAPGIGSLQWQSMLTPHTTVSIAPNVATQDLEEELILLQLEQGVYYSLDEIGMRFWRLIEEHDGEVAAAYDVMIREFEVTPERLWADIAALVERLVSAGLLTVRPAGRD